MDAGKVRHVARSLLPSPIKDGIYSHSWDGQQYSVYATTGNHKPDFHQPQLFPLYPETT